MLVLFVFDLVGRHLQNLLLLIRSRRLRAFGDHLPVEMVLGLRKDDAFAGNQLGRSGLIAARCHLHRFNQRLPDVLHDFATRRRLAGIESQRFTGFGENRDMVFGLVQILFPFLLQIIVAHALKCCLINLHASLFMFEGLKKQLLQLGGDEALYLCRNL